jgi:hypothetical protein
MKQGINRKERTGSKDWLSIKLHSPDIKHSKHIVTIMKHTHTQEVNKHLNHEFSAYLFPFVHFGLQIVQNGNLQRGYFERQ